VGAIGMATDARDLVLRVPEEARDGLARVLAARGLDGRGPLVVLHPGCSMPARTYPWELYAEVAGLLARRLGATVALTGTEDERELVARVWWRIDPRWRRAALQLAGELDFPAFCALVDTADLTITNNTGPMHVAAALKTPVVALFALTNPPEQWGPWQVPHRQLYHDVPCRICYSRVCPHGHECLRLVEPAMVVAAAEELLTEAAGRPVSLVGGEGRRA
ncbi:MAG TPA: glycosyltransferase family 9 protein, partial [Thermomicrobiaceae bacterium]|nr:glycosyltransferase family 9 protein [Thermomicrobiaceae bacterium]